MKRPLVWCAAAFALGTAAYLNFTFEFLFIVIGCIIFTSYFYRKLIYLIIVPVFFLGMLAVFLFNRTYIVPVERFSGSDVSMAFEITDVASTRSSGGFYQYTVKSRSINNSEFELAGYLYSPQKFSVGDIGKGECSIYPASEDGEYMFNKINRGCYFTSFSLTSRAIGRTTPGLLQKIRIFSKNLTNDIINSTNPGNSGFLTAILTGDKENLSSYRIETFRKTGLSHLMAGSGLHVSLLLGFLFAILNIFRTRRLIINIICSAFLLFLIPFMNFSPSAIRAVIMNLVMLWSTTVKKDTDPLSSLSLAAIILLVFRPYSLKDLSFVLSFGATAGIILLSPVIENLIEKITKRSFPSFSMVLAVHIFIVPISAFYFGSFSLISIPANLLFVPVFPLILMLLVISVATGNHIPAVTALLDKSTEVYLEAIETVSEIPFINYEVNFTNFSIIWLMMTSALAIAFKSKMRLMFLIVSVLILLQIIFF